MVPENVTNAQRSASAEGQSGARAPRGRAPWRNDRGHFARQRRAKEAIPAIVAAFGVKRGEQPVAGGAENHPAIRRAARARPARPDRAHFGLYGRTAQGDDRRQRRRRLCAGDDAAAPPARKTAQRRRRELGRHEPLSELLRDRSQARHSAPDHRRDGESLRQRRRFPALDASAGDAVEAFYSEPDDIDSRAELLYATVTAHDQIFQILPLRDARRRHGRLLRRERPVDAQVPHPQADRRRRTALRLRHALSSDPALRAHAYRRRLVECDRNADPCGRQRHDHQGRIHRLRTARRDSARQRLCHDLFAYVGLRARRCRRARASSRAR